MLDKIATELLEAARYPEEWNTYTTGAIFQMQLGTVASLLGCRRLLDVYRREQKDVSKLHDDFEAALDFGLLPWDLDASAAAPTGSKRAGNLRVWAIGYFLNKAQQNVDANLAVITTAWLEAKDWFQKRRTARSVGSEIMLVSGLPHYLQELQILVTDQRSRRLIQALQAGLSWAPTDSLGLRRAIRWFGSLARQRTYSGIYVAFPRSARFAAIAHVLANIFKHHIGRRHLRGRGAEPDAPLDYAIEWALTARAHQWVAQYLQALLKDPDAHKLVNRGK